MLEPIVFKCEDSLWRMLESGVRRFDMRRFDLADDLICRLARGHAGKALYEAGLLAKKQISPGEPPEVCGEPVEKQVSFLNKATGKLLIFEYLGMEFAPWAPGWCFLIVGRRLS